MGDINDTAAAGAEEKRVVEPAFAMFQSPSNENVIFGETD
jgi:hypothetical protein